MRTFIALDLPREVISEIEKIRDTVKKKVLFTGKYTEPENLHLTLKFLGEVDEEKTREVKKLLNEIKIEHFRVELGEIGIFSKSFPKILWIKLNGKGIWELQKEIDNKLKDIFAPEERFMSHITIARIKNVSSKKEFLEYLKSLRPKKHEFVVNEFFLKKSELLESGPVYTDLEEYKLL